MTKKIVASLIIMLVVLSGVFASYTIAKSFSNADDESDSDEGINSYEDCIDAGNLPQETAPPRCMTADGKTFIEGKKYLDKKEDKIKSNVIMYGYANVPQISLDKYKSHCVSVGGTFNQCGTFSDIKVCALICENVVVKDSDKQVNFKVKEKNGKYEIKYESDGSKYKIKYNEGNEYEFDSDVEIKGVIGDEIRIKKSDGSEGKVKIFPNDAVKKAFAKDSDKTLRVEPGSFFISLSFIFFR